ncbi:NADH-quinone oxidoreductase subunit NuoE [Effusibacillus consociatus]|uniref:NADH-quinone oxidoreductase subunit NuoE n=1 Tax=Effusibacillus consociatus TaxID=1117041 RepID=A0ABV9Q2L5_9BACL
MKFQPFLEKATDEETAQARAAVDEVLSAYGRIGRDLILPLLHAVQDACGWIPEEAMKYMSERNKVPFSDIYGVATFYELLSTNREGKHFIRVCDDVSCFLGGSSDILAVLEEELGIKRGETTKDGMFTIKVMPCLGVCEKAPAMLIDQEVHGNLTCETAREWVRRMWYADSAQ